MALDIQRYTYTPVYVRAVQVTAENMKQVAKWCGGQIHTQGGDTPEPQRYIKVDVIRPMRLRQTQAFAGDWVLRTAGGWKVYTQKAFSEAFVHAPDNHDKLIKTVGSILDRH